ncbi:MAG: M42 family metallopeptidase [Dehalococcoidia bacterium]|nr:MAG: M42 family metallopeptidase [Dehalococcoidia bacterium]
MDNIEKLLKQLTEVNGVAGYEREVREVIKPCFQQFGEITQDKLGSLICKKTGSSQRPKLALAAHMDEIGFMVKHITKEGFIKFTSLGGWWDQVLLAQRVFIKTHKGDVVGVIGAKPPHLLSDEECKKVVEKKDMYIDIGATSKEEVEEVDVRLGDPIIPISNFTILANSKTYLAKALDDRVGCALAILTMQKLANINHPNTVFAVATTQEEIGARGATTSVELIDPDLAIILEVDIAGDVPEIKPEESSIKLGGGPTLLTYDVRMIPNLKLRDLVVDTAKEKDIPLQLSAQEGGSTDGGPIHLHKIGVPTVVISVPTRHIHSHGAIIHRQDFDRTVDLVTAIVKRLDSKTVRELTL